MRRIFVAAFGLLICTFPAAAQSTSNLSLSGGYTLRLFTEPPSTRIDMNGFYVSTDYNLFKHFGAEAEISDTLADRGTNGNVNILTGMVGPRFYPFGHHKATVFGHVLFGEGYYRVQFPTFGGFPPTTTTYVGVAWEAGGGVEYKHSNRWSIRIVEADFGQTKFYGGSQSQSNYRVSLGVIYHFGQK